MNTTEILKLMNVSDDVLKVVAKEDATTEEVTAAVTKWKEHQKTIAEQNYASVMKEEVRKEQMASISKPAVRELRKMFNFTEAEVEGKVVKEVVQMGADKMKTLIKEAKKETDATLAEKADKLAAELAEARQEITIRDGKLEDESKRVEREINSFKVKNYLNTLYNGLEFDDKGRAPLYTDFLNRQMEQYDVDPKTGAIKNQDGTAVQNPDGSGVWETADKAVEYFAEQNKMIKQSRGGEGDRYTVEGEGDKQVDLSYLRDFEKKVPVQL